MNVLFICRGNVGRSQIAEAIYKKNHGTNFQIASAGTRVLGKDGTSRDGQTLSELGDAAKEVVQVLQELDINVLDSVRTQLTPDILNQFEKVIVMAEPETIPEYLKERTDAIYWNVLDPKGMNLEDTRKIRDQISTLIDSM